MNKKTDRQTPFIAACVLGWACALPASPALADDHTGVDTIVVTGARVTDLLRNIPNSTTVLDLGQIEAQNHANVLDLLRNAPGLQVTQPGGRGGVASVFIRGGEPNFTMVLVDGVRVNDPNNTRGGSFDFSTLNVSDIERIEIVRGPQSAVYGSDALAGVINVITKGRADSLGATLFAEVGEDEYERAAVEVSGPAVASGGFALRVATVDDGDATPGNRFESDSVSGKLVFGEGEERTLRLFGRWSDNSGSSFPEDSGGPTYAVLPDLDRKSSEDLSFGFTASLPLPGGWRLNASGNRYDHEDAYVSPGVAPGVRDGVPPNQASSELDRDSFGVHVVGQLSDSLKATVGVDYYDEEGRSEGEVEFFPGFSIPSGFELDRSVTGAFAEVQLQPSGDLSVLASLRSDEPNREPGETTFKIGALYSLNDGRSTLRANWGEGFKLPSFFALASPLVGNPDLRSEKSESADIGLTQQFADGAASATLTLYRNEYTDLIDFDFDLFTNVNRSEVVAKGAELQLDYRLSDALGLFAELTYLDLEIKDSDVPLRQRPDWRGSLSALWSPADDWKLHASWLYVGDTFDSSIPTGPMMLDPYHRIDAALTWQTTDTLQLVLSIDNLLDESYEEAIGFMSPGRRARLAARVRF